nr:MAG TPA: hypothetical protein [Caudoviricetes sp.]
MKTVYMRVMIDEPNVSAYTKAFRGSSPEHCIEQLHDYLESTTELGTRCSVVFCGYEQGEYDEVKG